MDKDLHHSLFSTPPPPPEDYTSHLRSDDEYDNDNDTASAKSISLSSAPASARNSSAFASLSTPSRPNPHFFEFAAHDTPPPGETELLSETDSLAGTSTTSNVLEHDTDELETRDSPISSATPSLLNYASKAGPSDLPSHDTSESTSLQSSVETTYPPPSQASVDESSRSGSPRKARPESLLIDSMTGPLILGVALVDFNHLIGPQIEWSEGAVFEDPEIARILPFLALPDGAHLSSEDYSYFHLVPSSPKPQTIFGISCNRQISSATLLSKDEDVTRSTVQKAIVVLSSKPIFGPIRDKLGVVTRAFFAQRDFRDASILSAFHTSLEQSLRHQLTESAFYMGTNLRELVHVFRHRTLILLKALLLQKKILFYGHPVEKLCTFQYSLVSLVPGLLNTLEDCGSPPLESRAPTLSRPTSLRTSDRKSLNAYLGLPLDIFGKDAFFQPYLPLQQLDLLKETKSWLCGSTNSIITQQKDMDILVNIETNTLEFRNSQVERLVNLTAADRKWIDDLVRDVNQTWNEGDPTRPTGMQFKGSDDYLRSKFEEYISSGLAAVKYGAFLAKGDSSGVIISGGSPADATSIEDFNPMWIAGFKQTNAFEVWERITDPLLFDIVEPRHPCPQKPNQIADIGLRLQEGLHELKIDQQLAPTREALSNAITAGSTSFLKAVDGVRGRWTLGRSASSASVQSVGSSATTTTSANMSNAEEINPAELAVEEKKAADPPKASPPTSPPPTARPLSVVATQAGATVSAWGSGLGSFLSSRASVFGGRRSSAASVKSEGSDGGPRPRDSLGGGSASSIRSLSSRSADTIPEEEGNVPSGKDTESIAGDSAARTAL
ncbi:hypothetical protein SISNIDRAFT_483460 [Sistotremastrum niveocremeum HHB9708]|uniref:UDENN domain-containing protein n=1 Tax=Sistotremastrum niveocremeum HHB9708 TaxID=1314777 RepID=A0A164XK63_9AGAM|nr:hypothetical protein SISNIDRAFT_483460 [Sistotremastrum niveocremeum HHB9708]